MKLDIINPIDYPSWDEMVLAHPGRSFFHSSAWARVLHESYGYKPLYFTVFRDRAISTMVPIMEVKSAITGKRGVSLPFSDLCEPVVSEPDSFKKVFEHLVGFGRGSGWKFVEIRYGESLFAGAPHSSCYSRHVVDLSKGAQTVFSRLRDSTRRNIRKAEREGVKAAIHTSLDAVREFYRLNCLTRRDHGLPPQPYSFFKNLHEYVVSRGFGFVVLASYRGGNIAGAFYLHFGEKAYYKYGVSDRRYQHLRANNLVMWEAMKWYLGKGYKTLCLGRTEPENQGLVRFKAGWGAQETALRYFRYDLTKGAFVKSALKLTGPHNSIFGRMPVPLLKPIGSVLYRHVG